MEQELYENLLKEFEQGTCVLVLGPEFFMLQNNEETLVENLRDSIYSKREKLKDKPYLSEDGFFYVNKISPQRNTILFDIQDYFRHQTIPDYYDTLCNIPFKLVINLSPDDYLSRSLTRTNRAHEFLFYKNGLWRRSYDRIEKKFTNSPITEPNKLAAPTVDNPWIFNFLGICEDKDSMVFTFDALFEFLYSVFPINNIPDKLKLEIQKAGTFLFMGFNYDKWYLKIIFFILHKICETTGVIKTAMVHAGEKRGSINFFQSQFNINFYKDNTISFLDKLKNDYAQQFQHSSFRNPNKYNGDNAIAPNKKTKILYLSSAPNNVMPIRFDKDYTVIQNCLQKKLHRDDFTIGFKSITNKGFLPTVDQESPNVIILSQHGGEGNVLVFENHDGEEEGINVTEFAKDISTISYNKMHDIQCIIFSSCHSVNFAISISSFVPFAVGVEGAIHEEAMTEFCEGFFESFFNTRDYLSAYQMGLRYLDRRSEYRRFRSQVKLVFDRGASSIETLQVAV